MENTNTDQLRLLPGEDIEFTVLVRPQGVRDQNRKIQEYFRQLPAQPSDDALANVLGQIDRLGEETIKGNNPELSLGRKFGYERGLHAAKETRPGLNHKLTLPKQKRDSDLTTKSGQR